MMINNKKSSNATISSDRVEGPARDSVVSRNKPVSSMQNVSNIILARIDAIAADLEAKIESVDDKIEACAMKLFGKVDILAMELNARIDGVVADLTAKKTDDSNKAEVIDDVLNDVSDLKSKMGTIKHEVFDVEASEVILTGEVASMRQQFDLIERDVEDHGDDIDSVLYQVEELFKIVSFIDKIRIGSMQEKIESLLQASDITSSSIGLNQDCEDSISSSSNTG